MVLYWWKVKLEPRISTKRTDRPAELPNEMGRWNRQEDNGRWIGFDHDVEASSMRRTRTRKNVRQLCGRDLSGCFKIRVLLLHRDSGGNDFNHASVQISTGCTSMDWVDIEEIELKKTLCLHASEWMTVQTNSCRQRRISEPCGSVPDGGKTTRKGCSEGGALHQRTQIGNRPSVRPAKDEEQEAGAMLDDPTSARTQEADELKARDRVCNSRRFGLT